MHVLIRVKDRLRISTGNSPAKGLPFKHEIVSLKICSLWADVLKIFQSSVSTSYCEKCTPIGLNVSRDQCDQLAIFAHLLQWKCTQKHKKSPKKVQQFAACYANSQTIAKCFYNVDTLAIFRQFWSHCTRRTISNHRAIFQRGEITMQTVWPYLAKFPCIGKILNNFGKF